MRAYAHRLRLSVAGGILFLALGTAYLFWLVSINAELDQQLHSVESLLLERYATVPAYLNCLGTFGNEERYTIALTQSSLAVWRAARTESEIAAAAARMEQAMNQLAKVLNRFAQDGVTKEPEQAESLRQFVRLEEQRRLSRVRISEDIRSYNRAVERFNDKVLGVPGYWVAWISDLHARAPLYSAGRQ